MVARRVRLVAWWHCGGASVPAEQTRTALSSQPGRVTRRGISGKELLKQLSHAVHGRWRRRRGIDYDLSEHSSGHGSALVVGT